MKSYVVYFKDFFVIREAKTSQAAMEMAAKDMRSVAIRCEEGGTGSHQNKLTKFFR